MAKSIDQGLQELDSELSGAVSRIQSDVVNYEARIAALEASQGSLTPAQEAELDRLKALVAAIDPTNPDILPPA